MIRETNNLNTVKNFREVNRFGFSGHLSHGLKLINSTNYILTKRILRLFCSKVANHSQTNLQSLQIMGLKPRDFHV